MQKLIMPLCYCPDCKEKSIKVKCYTRKKDGKRCRVEFCINIGCGYKKDLMMKGGEQNVNL